MTGVIFPFCGSRGTAERERVCDADLKVACTWRLLFRVHVRWLGRSHRLYHSKERTHASEEAHFIIVLELLPVPFLRTVRRGPNGLAAMKCSGNPSSCGR